MLIKKFKSFINLSGLSKEDNLLIQKEKIRWIFLRLLTIMTKKNYYSIGDQIKKPIIINTSKGYFLTRVMHNNYITKLKNVK